MSHGSTEHNLEEAHHAQHASLDNFTRNVAMTMAILAAGLAFVTLISHRSHNETIQLQIKSNDNLTEASNKWGYYQAKKNRQYMGENFANLLEVSAPKTGKEDQATKQIDKLRSSTEKWKSDADAIEKEARGETNKAHEFEQAAHLSHRTSDFFDLGHLGLEMALVICSLAVLTRRSIFWFVGIVIGVVGLAVALSGFVIPPMLHHDQAEPAKHDETQPEHKTPESHSSLRSPLRSGWELPTGG